MTDLQKFEAFISNKQPASVSKMKLAPKIEGIKVRKGTQLTQDEIIASIRLYCNSQNN